MAIPFELCKDCIDEGFTSVMIDASHEPFDKNVEICRRVVDYAHKYNAWSKANSAIWSARSSMKEKRAAVYSTDRPLHPSRRRPFNS